VAYEVRLDVFEGPIDLLLHLITRQRVDIYEVSIATITEEYMGAVAGMEPLDLDSATGFLIVAATLLELKSARLLPSRTTEVEEALLEQRDLLLARLVECATFRDAGTWIAGRLAEGRAFHGRSVALEEPFVELAPDPLERVGVRDLAAAAARALVPRQQPVLDTSHVAPITATVKDAIVTLADRLGTGRAVAFHELCADAPERIEIVVRFLALLELYKAGAIDLDQIATFGDIVATWTGEVDVAAVLAEADEYVAAPEVR
jgi:segregation and condensation protein A